MTHVVFVLAHDADLGVSHASCTHTADTFGCSAVYQAV
jgi:hypothetical protein